MSSSIFNVRRFAILGKADVAYTASRWDNETKLIYLLGRRPGVYFEKFMDPDSPMNGTFQKFLDEHNIRIPEQNEVAETAAFELANRIVTDELIERLGTQIASVMTLHKSAGGREFTRLRVVCPFPINPEETGNQFAPALASLITMRLEDRLGDILKQNGLKEVLVMSELDDTQVSIDQAILNVVNNDRGSTSDPDKGQEGLVYSERLVRQPVFTGPVDTGAIYVPVDDFLVAQSTLAGLMSYIQSAGGVTTDAVVGCELFTGIGVMEPQQATLDYLNATVPQAEHAAVVQLMSRVGLRVDFEDLHENTLSNVEMMFLAGVFADPQNPDHKGAFDAMLAAIGATPEEAKGNSPSDIFYAAPMGVEALAAHFEKVLDSRKPLVELKNPRVMERVSNNAIINFFGWD